jgi:RNA polymerase primary sigma factor
MPVERVRHVLKVAREPLSLATPVRDEDESQLGDFAEDKEVVLPIDAAIQSNLRDATTRALEALTPREERVIHMRFGIGTGRRPDACGRWAISSRFHASESARSRPRHWGS